MTKTILIAALTLVSLSARVFAQKETFTTWNEQVWQRSRTDIRFSVPSRVVNIRDFIWLKSHNKIILELNNTNDYKRLSTLDMMIENFANDIAFYKDSLENMGSGNVRIDYSVWVDSLGYNVDSRFKDIRFKRYQPDGEAFTFRKAEVQKLKLEQDTVNFIIHVRAGVEKGTGRNRSSYAYAIRVSFLLNQYNELFAIAQDKEMLAKAIDTLQMVKKHGTTVDPIKFPASAIYRPFAETNRCQTFNGIIKDDLSLAPWHITQRSDKLILTLDMGAGLVRNTLCPTADIGISFYNMQPAFYTGGYQDNEINTMITLSMSPYFFFGGNAAGDHFVHDNWFLNLSMGGATRFMGTTTPLMMGGIGYLVIPNGNVFKNTTMKAFIDFKLRNSITICPELISTNNFKQIFPGITVKIF